MARRIGRALFRALIVTVPIFAGNVGQAQPAQTAAKDWRAQYDLAALKKVDVDALVAKGWPGAKSDYASVIREADEHIAGIRARQGYTAENLDLLTSPWRRTKECIALLREGQPLPVTKLAVRTERKGICDCGEVRIFRGDARRAVAILREIGLKDAANGKSWSEAGGFMDRVITVLGQAPNGDIVVRGDIILGVNKWFDFVYNQIFNLRDIERYAERDLGNGNHVVIQDDIRDDSAGAPTRAPTHFKRGPKPYHPIKEWMNIFVLHDNGDGTFTLGNFQCIYGQDLKRISGGAKILATVFMVDLEKIMREDTISTRRKWNSLFRDTVLAPAP